MSRDLQVSSPEVRYNVYKVRSGPVIPDPDVPGVRYHAVIFVECKTNGDGYISQVTGDLVTGMQYEFQMAQAPELSDDFYDRLFLGTMKASSLSELNNICASLPPPPRQKAFNINTMATELVKLDGTFYSKDEPRPPIIKCTEWIDNHAIPALQQAQIINDTQPVPRHLLLKA